MSVTFSHKLTDSNIYAHLLYRIHEKDAEAIDGANFLPTLERATQIANKDLQHSDCNIVILADPESTIPEEGMGGRAWGDDYIRIVLDPHTTIGLKEAIETYLPGTVAHELHHVRRAKNVGYGETLGEALVSEGLAQAYQEFLYLDVLVDYAHNLTSEELGTAWNQAQSLLRSHDYDHDSWFYGSDEMKRWTGYSLGFDIVKSYLLNHPEENAAKLVDVPAKQILDEYVRSLSLPA